MAGSTEYAFSYRASAPICLDAIMAAGPEPRESHPILVVEDEVIIGLGLMATLEMAGFEVIGPAVSVESAMDMLDRHDCALAILDVNLGAGKTSEPLAERLNDEGIPFLITSAYAPEDRADIFNHVPSFAKPIGARTIVTAVQAALA